VKRLECLPLALALAGRYMFSTKTSPGKYLQLYQEQWIELQKKHPQLREYGNGGIHTTWTISYERIRKSHPIAADLLILWAYFDKQDLWYELLIKNVRFQPEWFQKLVKSELDFKDAVGTLLTYSIVEEHSVPDSYSMHSVVHEWCLEHFWEDNKQSMIPMALGAIGSMVPDGGRFIDSMLPRRLLPHAMRQVYLQSRTEGKLKEDLHGSVYEREITLRSLNGLGVLFRQQGRLAEAKAIYIRALAGTEETLGSEHGLSLDIVNNLGILFWQQGKLAEAEAFYMRALSGEEKVLGPEHISTLNTINNLGILYEKQGKLAQSEAFYIQALSGYEKVLGPEHISTLDTINNLGVLYEKQGKLAQSEAFYIRALSGYEKVLGLKHISSLRTINNLGVLFEKQGRLAESEAFYMRALAGYEKILGLDHISTLETVESLGILYQQQGRLPEAETFYKRALSGREKALGLEHAKTLEIRGSLKELRSLEENITRSQ
jgi:tetratricopeptide (TPR) repeat protein